MTTCEFLTADGTCCFTKQKHLCDLPEMCEKHNKQYPKDKEIFTKKFKKDLSKALRRRTILDEINQIVDEESHTLDYSLSVYQNVKNSLSKLDKITLEYKDLKSSKDLNILGNVLSEYVKSPYKIKKVTITEYDIKNNSLIIEDDGRKFLIKIKEDVKKFIVNLLSNEDKENYFRSNIEEYQELRKT